MSDLPATSLAFSQTRDWITALVVGITTTMLRACGVILAYKKLRRGQIIGDLESSNGSAISLQDTAEDAPTAQGL
jgi:putative Mn2+ efflux pump MntP